MPLSAFFAAIAASMVAYGAASDPLPVESFPVTASM
jgi:hypothetical protein